MVLFLVSDRYRVATWPVLVLLAAIGGLWLVSQRDRWAVVVLVVGLVVSWVPIDERTALDPA
jgi:hypothetical protein